MASFLGAPQQNSRTLLLSTGLRSTNSNLNLGGFTFSSNNANPQYTETVFTSKPNAELLSISTAADGVVGLIGRNAPVVRTLAIEKTTINTEVVPPTFQSEKQALRTGHIYLTRDNVNTILGEDVVKNFHEYKALKNTKDAVQDTTLASHTTQITAIEGTVAGLALAEAALAVEVANLAARKNVIPVEDSKYFVGLSNQRWLEVNAIRGNFGKNITTKSITLSNLYDPTSSTAITFDGYLGSSNVSVSKIITKTETCATQEYLDKIVAYVPPPTYSFSWAEFGLIDPPVIPEVSITDNNVYLFTDTGGLLYNKAYIDNVTITGFDVKFTETVAGFVTPVTLTAGSAQLQFTLNILGIFPLYGEPFIKFSSNLQTANIYPRGQNYSLGSPSSNWQNIYSSNVTSRRILLTKTDTSTHAAALSVLGDSPNISLHNLKGTSNIIQTGRKQFTATELQDWFGYQYKVIAYPPVNIAITFPTPFSTVPTVTLSDPNTYLGQNQYNTLVQIFTSPWTATNITTTGFTLTGAATVKVEDGSFPVGIYFYTAGTAYPPYNINWTASGATALYHPQDRLRITYPVDTDDLYVKTINGALFGQSNGNTTFTTSITNTSNYLVFSPDNLRVQNLVVGSTFDNRSQTINNLFVPWQYKTTSPLRYGYLYSSNWHAFVPYPPESVNMSFPKVNIDPTQFINPEWRDFFTLQSSTDGLMIYYTYKNNSLDSYFNNFNTNTYIGTTVTKNGKRYLEMDSPLKLTFTLTDQFTSSSNLPRVGMYSSCNIYIQNAVAANKFYEGGTATEGSRLLSKNSLLTTYSGTPLPSLLNNSVYDTTCNIWVCRGISHPPVSQDLFTYLQSKYGTITGDPMRGAADAPIVFKSGYTQPFSAEGGVGGPDDPTNPPSQPNPSDPPNNPDNPPNNPPNNNPPTSNPPSGGPDIARIVGIIIAAILGGAALIYGVFILSKMLFAVGSAFSTTTLTVAETGAGALAVEATGAEGNTLSVMRPNRGPRNRASTNDEQFKNEIARREGRPTREDTIPNNM